MKAIPKKYLSIIQHYENCLEKHGDSHLGVDWPVLSDVEKRYNVMLGITEFNAKNLNEISLLDFGCGAAHLYEYIQKNKIKNITYSGLDISEKFIELCKKKYPELTFFCEDIIEKPKAVPAFDYVVMNGVFTEKRDLSYEEMMAYFQELVTHTFSITNRGLAFNVMSKAVDWEREDLFHLSTDTLIDFVTKNLTRNFIIRNDYGLYEYSVYLFK